MVTLRRYKKSPLLFDVLPSPAWPAPVLPTSTGLGRPCKDAAHPRIHVFLATSDIHLKYKLRITREQCLAQASEAVRHAKSLCSDIQFSPEDATRTDIPFLCQVVEAVIAAGATTVNIPDTVGYSMPEEYGHLIRTLREKVAGIENVTISTHCHNDLGLAVANSLAAVQNGARQVECTINGIGERAGNASLEEVAMAMHVRADRYPYETGLGDRTDLPVQPDAGRDHRVYRYSRTKPLPDATRSPTKPASIRMAC